MRRNDAPVMARESDGRRGRRRCTWRAGAVLVAASGLGCAPAGGSASGGGGTCAETAACGGTSETGGTTTADDGDASTGQASGTSTLDGGSDTAGQPPSAVDGVFEEAVGNGFSGVAVVRHEGEIVLHAAAGFAARQAEIANELDTPIVIGSLTKQFTAAAILKLADDGALSLEDTLGDVFADAPPDKADITVHQLLTHSAGFPDAIGDDEEPIERAAYLERAWDTPLLFDPGLTYAYSNVGYSLLAAIIEMRAGVGYEAFVNESLLTPANMHHTGYLLPDWDGPQPALGYDGEEADDPLARPHNDSGYYWNLRGNGGWISTTQDLLAWHDALDSGAVLDSASVAMLTTPYIPEGLGALSFYGYGWAIEDTDAGRLAIHDGGNGFFYAEFARYLDADLQVVMLANEANEASEGLTRRLAAAVIPDLLLHTWEVLLLRNDELEDSSITVEHEVAVEAGQRHVAAVSFLLQSGSASWEIVAPDQRVVESDDVQSQVQSDRFVTIDDVPGTWTLRIETTDATGALFAAWAKYLGEGAPCPDGSECAELPGTLGEGE